MGSALTFFQRYWEGDEFLDRIVTGDETWVQFVNAETKVGAHAFSQQAQEIQTNTVERGGRCVTPEGATTPKQIVKSNSSVFRGILNGKFDLIIIHFYAEKQMHLIFRKPLSCELKIYHIVSSMKRICCTHTVISTLCIFKVV